MTAGELGLGDQIEAYVSVLLGLVALEDIYEAVDALLARDSQAGWWREEAET